MGPAVDGCVFGPFVSVGFGGQRRRRSIFGCWGGRRIARKERVVRYLDDDIRPAVKLVVTKSGG
jgi:hypothetical protein